MENLPEGLKNYVDFIQALAQLTPDKILLAIAEGKTNHIFYEDYVSEETIKAAKSSLAAFIKECEDFRANFAIDQALKSE